MDVSARLNASADSRRCHFESLINALGRSLVSDTPAVEYEKAEEDLYRSVLLLGESRLKQKKIAARKKKDSRDKRQRKAPGKRKREQVKFQVDKNAKRPDATALNKESLEELESIVDTLKPKHRERVQALIDSGGCPADAAKRFGITTHRFNQRYRQSTKKRVNEALIKFKKDNEAND